MVARSRLPPPPPLPPPLVLPPAAAHLRPHRSLPAEYLAGLVDLQQSGSNDAEEDRERDGRATGDDDTITAIVTGAAAGAVSIIRLSGGDAVAIAQAIFRLARGAGGADWQPESHRVYYGRAVDAGGGVLDEVLVLAMLEPRSYTAEDVVEIHTHGGGISAQRVLQVGRGVEPYGVSWRCAGSARLLAAAGGLQSATRSTVPCLAAPCCTPQHTTRA